MSLNVAAFTGRLTADPELRHTNSDTAVTSFTIAVDRNYCKQGEDRQTDWIDCVAWRGTAEFICRNFTKGKMVAVDGSMQTSTYTDSQGTKRKKTELVISNVNFCGSKSDNSGGSGQSAPAAQNKPEVSTGDNGDFVEIDGDDDLPF